MILKHWEGAEFGLSGKRIGVACITDATPEEIQSAKDAGLAVTFHPAEMTLDGWEECYWLAKGSPGAVAQWVNGR